MMEIMRRWFKTRLMTENTEEKKKEYQLLGMQF
jgi:hypothetical protein